MNPREWKNKFDMSVAVGLGTGSKDQIMQSIGGMFQMQMAMAQAGLPIVQPVNFYNTLAKYAEAAEMKGEGLYVTHPDKIPPQPPQPNPEMVKVEAEMKLAEADFQRKAQDDQRKAQLEERKLAATVQTEMVLGEKEIAAKKEMKAMEIQADTQGKVMDVKADMMLERERMASEERVNAMPDALAQLAAVAKELAEARKPRKRKEKGTFNGKKYEREITEE
jgi:hypothetical protein